MKYPNRKFLGFTWVGWLNRLVVQWFWCRLQGEVEDDGTTKWQVITPVAPLTGWRTSYWPRQRKTLNLT